MSIIRDFKNYVFEEEFKITIKDNKIDIMNYIDISHFDNNKIIINYKNGILIISGKSLVVSKLLSDELLIEGNIEKIEFR